MGPIPANSPLKFSIEVVEIEPANKPEATKDTKAEQKEEPNTDEKPVEFSVKVTKDGEGHALSVGDKALIHYEGFLLDGTKIDSSYAFDRPLPFTLGKEQVIKCWEKGLKGLAQGAKAELVCPSDLAYGQKSMGRIPEHSPLKYNIEIMKIEPKKKDNVKEDNKAQS